MFALPASNQDGFGSFGEPLAVLATLLGSVLHCYLLVPES